MQLHMLPKQKKARSGFGSESKKAACQGALNLWSNLSLIFLQPETSVSRDARSHWHYSPEKLTAWTVKHGALVRNHTERLIAISYQLHQHSLTHLLTLLHSLANPKKKVKQLRYLHNERKVQNNFFFPHLARSLPKYCVSLWLWSPNPNSLNGNNLKLLSELFLLDSKETDWK